MIEPGLQATVEETVTEDMTAGRLGSGDVPVLGTPAVLALVEAAAVAAVADALEPGTTTVGSGAELEHLAPTPVGATVTATTGVRDVDGRKITFAFEVTDPAGPVARGTHERVVVDRERFLESARKRA
ncbi:MAG: thioesterase family protein [Actinomycetota bacterium]|jgi:fluoroacetyl-CoA thioesterase